MRVFGAAAVYVALCACSEHRPAGGRQATAPDTAALRLSSTEYQLAGGAIRFRAPTHWHIVQAPTAGNDETAIFHIRDAATDSGPDRTNVVLWVLHGPATMPFRTATDTLLAALNGPILEDTILGRARDRLDPERRFVFWMGQQGETRYMLFDDFSRWDTLMVYVRVAVPSTAGSSLAWHDSLEAGTRLLLASVMLGDVSLFPGWAGHPTMSLWGPQR